MDKIALTTKRLVLGHVSVCQGCCCGNIANGKPGVPVEWLKEGMALQRIIECRFLKLRLTMKACRKDCPAVEFW
jgi:hypothetical protein